MSTELETGMQHHGAATFWGGDKKGVCLQISATSQEMYTQLLKSNNNQPDFFLDFDLVEAAALAETLATFVKKECLRRQALLKKQVEALKSLEKTVFFEVAELPEQFFNAGPLPVKMVSTFCPIKEEI
jgi:hypothetical protein